MSQQNDQEHEIEIGQEASRQSWYSPTESSEDLGYVMKMLGNPPPAGDEK